MKRRSRPGKPVCSPEDRALGRREPRYSVPVFSVRIRAELVTKTDTYHGVLWDISCHGACLQCHQPVPLGIDCELRLYQHAGPQIITRRVHLIWTDSVMNVHYAGMSMKDPIPMDDSTFLGILVCEGTLPTK
jgi:hypothetical protein